MATSATVILSDIDLSMPAFAGLSNFKRQPFDRRAAANQPAQYF
jgi:hypothetical protein